MIQRGLALTSSRSFAAPWTHRDPSHQRARMSAALSAFPGAAGYHPRMGMVFLGGGLLVLALFALTGGALLTAVVLGAGGLTLMVTGALRFARSLEG